VTDEFQTAVGAALNGEWDKSHVIVQEYGDATACWIHAVLHKIEGDPGNSRYWYARAHRNYEDFADPMVELEAIADYLQSAAEK